MLRVEGFEDCDFDFVTELISPPKKELVRALANSPAVGMTKSSPRQESFLADGTLGDKWSQLIKGRDFKDAWMYEIVSN